MRCVARLDAHHVRWVILCASLLSLHPVFVWMARRTVDGSDEPWGAVACLAAALLLVKHRRPPPTRLRLAPESLLLVAYLLSLWFFTPLPRALLAMTALALLFSQLLLARRLDLGLLGCLWLSLPLMASLEFYCSYPLRTVVAKLAAGLLSLSGHALSVEGVGLRIGDQLVVVDAPCSGLKMLWAGGLVTSIAVGWLRLTAARATLAFAGAFVLLVGANALRAAALFHVELGVFEVGELGHSLVGVVVFAAASAAIVCGTRWLGGQAPCSA